MRGGGGAGVVASWRIGRGGEGRGAVGLGGVGCVERGGLHQRFCPGALGRACTCTQKSQGRALGRRLCSQQGAAAAVRNRKRHAASQVLQSARSACYRACLAAPQGYRLCGAPQCGGGGASPAG